MGFLGYSVTLCCGLSRVLGSCYPVLLEDDEDRVAVDFQIYEKA